MKRYKSFLLSVVLCCSCSARAINPEFSSEYHRAPSESFGYGLGSVTAGVAAPAVCGTYFAVYPLMHLKGQDAIGVYFIPFTALFGVLVGAARAVPMVGLGIADVATFGVADLSAEYFYSYNGLSQWCGCMYAKCVKEKDPVLQDQAPASSTDAPSGVPTNTF
jgi:hypothetical protein